MEEQNNWASGFEFVDIEIIDHHRQPEVLNPQKWSCDHCNLFYLSYENLMEHKKKHMNNSQVKCRYCNKVLSVTEESRECYANGKCETCEYRCSQCPKRFLRHSSLMNHENNHSQPKKNKRPHPRSANIEVPKLESTQKTVNKKILKTVDSEALCSNSAPVETDIPTKGKRKPSSSPKKRTRLQSQKPMIESNINDGDIDINNSRVSKRSSLILLKDNHNLKSSKQTKEKFIKTSDTAITKNQVGVSTPTAQTGTSSSEVNSVNYKPFSCHVCNDNFASENILLEHIKSHGDAAKHFKCRFCPEAFDTIYDIQYHLAVCPLAEDELESTLMNSTPPKLVITSPRSLNKPLTKGKRGRPKKFRDSLPNSKEEMVTSDIAKSDSAPLVRTRNKRKSLEKPVEPSNKILKVSSSSVPDTTVKNRSVEREVKFDDPQSNLSETDVTGDDYQSPNNDSFVTSVKNQEKHHSCPFPRCDRKFTREKALECHMRNHNDDLDETLQCYKCDIPFDDVKSLRMHVDECQGLREEKDDDFSGPKQNKTERQDANKTGPHKFGDDFLCKTCGRTYQSKEKLKRCLEEHGRARTSGFPVVINSHPKRGTPKSASFEETFKCRLCQAKCVDEGQLKKHFRSDHSGRLPFQCSNCFSEFDSELNESKHSCCKVNSEEFNCIVCSKKLPTYNHLYFHINKEHSQKDSICKFCNKAFPNGDALREHSLSHREGRRFTCAFCSKTYSNSQYLTLHMRRHTSSKVLKCKICFRAFLDKNALFQHMLFHASMPVGDTPYTCCLCSVSFSQRGGLKFHIEQSHIGKQKKIKKCPVCEETELELSMSNHIIKHCSRISSNKMTKVETEWIKKKNPKSSQESLLCKTNRKVKVELKIKPERYKRPSKYNSTETTSLTKAVGEKNSKKSANKESKFTVTKANRLLREKSATTFSKTIKSQVKKEKSEDTSFEEDLELINKRLEESSDSEFENGLLFHGFKVEPPSTLDSSDHENIVDLNRIKKEVSDGTLTSKREDCNSVSVIPARERKHMTVQPVKNDEPLTKARPMSFLLVTSKNEKTISKSTSDNYNKETSKNRELLEVTAKKRAFYRNKVRESRIKVMLSNTIVNERKLRTSKRHNKSYPKQSVKNGLGKENLSLENNNTSILETSEENILEQTECEEESKSPVIEESEPLLQKEMDEVEQDCVDVCIQEKKYFEPSLNLSKYSCTTCVLTFSSQEELHFHNTEHIF